jgi:predicted ATP-grasp superfamily ATP-dependent carboligase
LHKWLAKPLAGAGGAGIRPWQPGSRIEQRAYLQEFIPGPSCAALYLGTPAGSRLLGVTEQLVGEPWLAAGPFRYCGSVGPVRPELNQRATFERIGDVLTQGCHLRGLFGVDCVLRDGVPLPVEVNPRYTASVEVLEYATGESLLALHRQVFEPGAPSISGSAVGIVGKAVLFARRAFTFPADGPWRDTLRHPRPITELPAYADIPAAGSPIQADWPVLTLFARGDTMEECRVRLQHIAAEVERWLYV